MTIKKLFAACALIASLAAAAAPKAAPSPASFNLSGIAVSQAVSLIYTEALKTDFVMDPDVLLDSRLITFRYSKADGDIKQFVQAFMKSLGYSVETRSGVDYVSKTKLADVVAVEEEVSIYLPRYRDAAYLSRLLSPLLKGRFTATKSVAAPAGTGITQNVPSSSAAGQIDEDADALVFTGSRKEIQKLNALLPQLDIQKGEVLVKAVIYEVSGTKSEGSAFKLLVNVLNSKIGVSINTAQSDLTNSIKLSVGGFDALLTALSTDQRFNLLSQPRLRVRSGELAKIVVGQDVPVLGAVTYQQGGNAVQSVQYQSAGTILSITPTVHQASIDVKVSQQLSNFVSTTTGVNSSPTLIKRSLDTAITAASGDVIVLGGLTETKSTKGTTGLPFLPWNLSKQNDDQTVDVLVVLQLEKI